MKPVAFIDLPRNPLSVNAVNGGGGMGVRWRTFSEGKSRQQISFNEILVFMFSCGVRICGPTL